MKNILKFTLISVLLVRYLIYGVHNCSAQREIELLRVFQLDHEISLWVKFKCRWDVRFNIKPQDILITENGKQIKDFDIYPKDWNDGRVFIDFGLVFDVGSYMNSGNPTLLEKAKQNAITFSKRIDTSKERVCVAITANPLSFVLPFSNDTNAICAAIRTIRVDTISYLWDTSVFTSGEMMLSSTKSRALLIFTNGQDSTSQSKVMDVISVARSSGTTVVGIGMGETIDRISLAQIANDTGGKYLENPTAYEMNDLFGNLTTSWEEPPLSSTIRYKSPCSDGKKKDVQIALLSMQNCPDSNIVSAMGSCTSILDSANLYTLALESKTVRSGEAFDVALMIPKAFHRLMDTSTIQIMYDPSCIKFRGIDTIGLLLGKAGVEVIADSNRIMLRTTKSVMVDASGVIARLIFTSERSSSERDCDLSIAEWTFHPECSAQGLKSSRILFTANSTSVEEKTKERWIELTQNYPNPFSETTTILLPLLVGEGRGEVVDSPKSGEVADSSPRGDVRPEEGSPWDNPQSVPNRDPFGIILKFYDLFGREVLDLSEDARSNSSVMIHASQLPGAGMYFYRLSIGSQTMTRIMIRR